MYMASWHLKFRISGNSKCEGNTEKQGKAELDEEVSRAQVIASLLKHTQHVLSSY